MYYECLSVDIGCFSLVPGCEPATLVDPFSLLPGIRECRDYFLFRLVDIGPYEAFSDYARLREVVRAVRAADYTPRLLTTGRFFSDCGVTEAQFAELASLGVSRFVLRLDRDAAESLPEEHVVNFVSACASCGLNSDLRFDLQAPVPEAFFRVARRMEEARFYSNIYPKAILARRRIRLPASGRLEGMHGKIVRAVVTSEGTVLLRAHESETVEIEVGHLREQRLAEVLDPRRLVSDLTGAHT